jgi:Disulphide bond corrector protein DsbC
MKNLLFSIAFLLFLQACNNNPTTTPTPAEPTPNATVTPGAAFVQAGTHEDAKQPVKWTFSYRKTSAKTVELKFDAAIQPKWKIYSSTMDNVDGPAPTTFTFETPGVTTDGKLIEESTHRIEGIDVAFKMHIVKFKEAVSFTQKLSIPENCNNIKGFLEYIACDDEKCLPPKTVEFEVRF